MKKNVLPIVAAAMALTFTACQPTDKVAPAVIAIDTNPDELVSSIVNFLATPGNISTSGSITMAHARASYPSPQQIKAAFDAFDVDKSGQVSATELQAVLLKGGVPVTLAQCMGLIKVFDVNNSGMMEFNEFERLLSEALKQKK